MARRAESPDAARTGRTALWLSVMGCAFLALAAVYAAIKAETAGDLLMACMAVPLFGWAPAVMAAAAREKSHVRIRSHGSRYLRR